jgi:hypothetical protein
MSGMSASSHTHRPAHSAHPSDGVHAVPATPAGWFAVAATFTAAIVGLLSWAQLGIGSAVVILVATVALTGSLIASRRGRDAVVAFVSGTLVTVVGLYATLLVMAQFYSVAVQN